MIWAKNMIRESDRQKVPFLDLRVTESVDRQVLLKAVDGVLQHGRLVLGPEVEQLENAIASRCQRSFAVGVGSGTDAIILALRCLDIGAGDEVIVPALSWIATANAVRLTGARPVFADIMSDLTIDPESVKRVISPRTKAILPVHYTGKLCDMPALLDIGCEFNLKIIEDGAQAFDAEGYGKKAGGFGLLGCFSMNAMKVLASCGDAGMVVTDRPDFAQRLKSLRYNGTVNREECTEVSFNARLDTIQAAILLQRLSSLESVIERRRQIASMYSQKLKGVVKIPKERPGCRDVYYTYTILVDHRTQLMSFLHQKNVETKVRHPILMPMQPAYQESSEGEFDCAEKLVAQLLCLPIHEKMTDEQVEYVIYWIKDFYRKNAV